MRTQDPSLHVAARLPRHGKVVMNTRRRIHAASVKRRREEAALRKARIAEERGLKRGVSRIDAALEGCADR